MMEIEMVENTGMYGERSWEGRQRKRMVNHHSLPFPHPLPTPRRCHGYDMNEMLNGRLGQAVAETGRGGGGEEGQLEGGVLMLYRLELTPVYLVNCLGG